MPETPNLTIGTRVIALGDVAEIVDVATTPTGGIQYRLLFKKPRPCQKAQPSRWIDSAVVLVMRNQEAS